MKHVAPAVCLACLLLFASTYAFGQGFSQPQPRCCVCNQILFGDYLTIDGRYYHRDHFLCEYCKKPIRDTYLQADHKYYHAVCYEQHVMVVCAICKRAIGSDDKQDEWGNCYHARHFSEYKQCDFCGRLIFGGFAAGQRHFPDGRDLCGMCAATSVTTVAAAETLMVRAGRYLAADDIHVGLRGISVLLLSRDKMQTFKRGREGVVKGLTDFASFTDSHGRSEDSGANIYLLNGMPEMEMLATLAHELMHVWQDTHNPLDQDEALREGSANYAAYLVMKRVGTKESEFVITKMMKDTSPVYGDGFRRIRQYGDKHGVKGVIAVIASDHPKLTDD